MDVSTCGNVVLVEGMGGPMFCATINDCFVFVVWFCGVTVASDSLVAESFATGCTVVGALTEVTLEALYYTVALGLTSIGCDYYHVSEAWGDLTTEVGTNDGDAAATWE